MKVAINLFTLGTSLLTLILTLGFAAPAWSDNEDRELIRSIQLDLQALGHDVDDTSGRLTLQTRLSIGAVEEQYGLEATGKPSFDIAAKLRAERRAQYQNTNPNFAASGQPCVCPQVPSGQPMNAPPPLQADSACLQAKVDAKKTSKAKRIGSAAMRLLGRHGNRDVVDKAYEVTRSAQDVAATTNDVKTIADELGLSQDEVNECMK